MAEMLATNYQNENYSLVYLVKKVYFLSLSSF